MARIPTPLKIEDETDRALTQRLTLIFIEVMQEHSKEGFTADEIVAKCGEFDKEFLNRKVPAMFRIFQGTGYLRKLPTYRLSSRNSYPLPLWIQEKNLLPAYGAKRRYKRRLRAPKAPDVCEVGKPRTEF